MMIDVRAEEALLLTPQARLMMSRGPQEADERKRHGGAQPIDPRDFRKFLGLDPARSRDWFGKAIAVLPRVRTYPKWLPLLVWVGRHRGKKMPVAFRDIVYDVEEGGRLSHFRDFEHVVVDSGHDPTFAENLEERWPSRVTALKMTSPLNEAIYRTTYLWFRLGGSIPGHTGDAELDRSLDETRREFERLNLELTPSGRIKVDHHYNEHDDLAKAAMYALYKPMTIVRAVLGGLRAQAAVASGRAAHPDPLMQMAMARHGPRGRPRW